MSNETLNILLNDPDVMSSLSLSEIRSTTSQGVPKPPAQSIERQDEEASQEARTILNSYPGLDTRLRETQAASKGLPLIPKPTPLPLGQQEKGSELNPYIKEGLRIAGMGAGAAAGFTAGGGPLSPATAIPMSALGAGLTGAATEDLINFLEGRKHWIPSETFNNFMENAAWTMGLELLGPMLMTGSRALKWLGDHTVAPPLQSGLKWLGEQRIVPTFEKMIQRGQIHRETVMKTLPEVFQSGVERFAPEGAQAWREIQSSRSTLQHLGKKYGALLKQEDPLTRIDFIRALKQGSLRGVKNERSKQLLAEYLGEKKSLRVGRGMEREYNDALRSHLQQWWKPFSPVLKGRDPVAQKYLQPISDAMEGRSVDVKEMQSSIRSLIKDESVPKEIRNLAVGLHDIPTDVPEIAFKASREAATHSITELVKTMPNALRVSINPGEEGKYMKTLWSPFIKGGTPLYVKRDVELALRDYIEVPKISSSVMNKYFLSPWKMGKILFRPATHIRNTIGNAVLNWMGGLSPLRVDIYEHATSGMRSSTPLFQRFAREVGYEGRFIDSDIFRIGEGARYGANMIERAFSHFSQISAPMTEMYGQEEMLFKYAKYIHNLDKGMAHKDATWDAMKWTFNYGEVTRATARMRSSIMPFFTWQSKVIPLMLESATKYPLHYASVYGMYKGMQQLSLNSVKASDEEWSTLERVMPDYVKDSMFFVLPFRDARDRLQYLNLTFMVPGFGDLNELSENPMSSLLGNPLLQIASALSTNRRFNGTPICYDWEPPHVRVAKKTSYIWDALLPASAGPVPIGTDWNMIKEAWDGSPEGRTWGQVTSSLFGFKTAPMPKEKWARQYGALERAHLSEARSMLRRELRLTEDVDERSQIMEKYSHIFQDIPQED